ncbi:MAG: hypothetical protein NTNFB02_32820 [Nitrospira sp.]
MMRKTCAGLVTVAVLLGGSHALGQPATPENERPLYYKFVFGDDPDAGARFFKKQKSDRWCWAATADMIMTFHGQPQWLQCIQADDSFPGKSDPSTCCDDPESPLCNRSGWPHFERYGFQSKQTSRPLSWDQVVAQIDSGLPLAVAIKFVSGGGHMGTVIGYQLDEDGEQFVLVIDPDGFRGPAILKFKHLFGVAADGSYEHWRTYYDIAR